MVESWQTFALILFFFLFLSSNLAIITILIFRPSFTISSRLEMIQDFLETFNARTKATKTLTEPCVTKTDINFA